MACKIWQNYQSTCRWLKIRRPRGRPRPDPGPPINERLLKFPELRVISSTNAQLGVLASREALSIAESEGLDLVLVAPNAVPPVAKIVDHGKYKYEQDKLKKDQKRKTQDVKGIKISPNIAEHDLMVAVRKARQFLGDGDKVRVVCRFRARELAHPKRGEEKLEAISLHIAEVGKREKDPVLNGREMVVVFNPISNKAQGSQKKDAKAEDKQDSGEEV